MVSINVPMFIVMTLNLVASFGLLSLVSMGAEGKFKEKALYISYIVGLSGGVGAGILYAFLILYFLEDPDSFNIVMLVVATILLTMVNILFMVVFARFKTVYVEEGKGFLLMSLGLGFAAMLSAFLSFQSLSADLTITTVAGALMLILMNVYAYGSAGFMVGDIIQKRKPLHNLWRPALSLFPVNMIILISYLFNLWEGYIVGAVIYAIIAALVFYKLVLPIINEAQEQLKLQKEEEEGKAKSVKKKASSKTRSRRK